MTDDNVDVLAEFVLARVAEDEALAEEAQNGGPGGSSWSVTYTIAVDNNGFRDVGDGDARTIVEATAETPTESQAKHIETWDPERVLVECEVKRQLVEIARTTKNMAMLQWQASPYADHLEFKRSGGERQR